MAEEKALEAENVALTTPEIVKLGDAVIVDDDGRAIGYDHSVAERIVAARVAAAKAEALEEAADDYYFGSNEGWWLRERAQRLYRSGADTYSNNVAVDGSDRDE